MASTFVINYLPAALTLRYSDTCTPSPDDAKTSFEPAVSVWSTRVISSVPITIDACWATNLPTGVLGHAGSLSEYQNFTNAPLPNTFYKVALANALAGSKLNVGQSDMYIAYSSTFDWYYSADGNTPSDKIDFITVVAHEVAHGLGFAGGMTVSSGTGSYSKIFAYDRFAYNGSSQALLNTTIFPNPSTALGTVLTSNNVWFSGTKANIANNNTDVNCMRQTWAPVAVTPTWTIRRSSTPQRHDVFAVSYGRLFMILVLLRWVCWRILAGQQLQPHVHPDGYQNAPAAAPSPQHLPESPAAAPVPPLFLHQHPSP